MKTRFYFIIIGLILFASCQEVVPFSVQTTKYQLLKTYSSCSAMWANETGRLVILGDDEADICYVDSAWTMLSRVPLYKPDTLVNGRVPSKAKYDCEAVASFTQDQETSLYIFSSGSWSPMRDTCLWVNASDGKLIHKRSLLSLFQKLIAESPLKETAKINIEGAAILGDTLYLAHRGGNESPNVLFKLTLSKFQQFFTDSLMPAPNFTYQTFELPKIAAFKSGFSGLEPFGHSGLLFTASVEASNNPPHDGEVLGSFVGYIPFGSKTIVTQRVHNTQGQEIRTKLESISVVSQNAEGCVAVGVSDNDNGSSELFRFIIKGIPAE
jgi:hypothetical protein